MFNKLSLPLMLLALSTLVVFSCEKDSVGPGDEPTTNSAIEFREVPDVLCKDLCDGIIMDFNDLEEYQVVREYKGVKLSANEVVSRNPIILGDSLKLRIFDTVDPDQCNSFDDEDLIFPDGTFGNVLIIQDPNKKFCANDRSKGGMMTFDFSDLGTVNINCLTLFDTEESGMYAGQRLSGAIFLYDDNDNPIGTYIPIPGVTDGGAQVLELGVTGVARMEVMLLGSGAISSICLEEEDKDPGCTFTQGYWKNHEENWCVPTETTFEGGNEEWLDILKTPVRGNAYYILAHQYIATYLNVECVDADTDAIEAEYALAGEWLATHSPNGNISKAEKEMLTGWATQLDLFNNGEIGPGHCGDEKEKEFDKECRDRDKNGGDHKKDRDDHKDDSRGNGKGKDSDKKHESDKNGRDSKGGKDGYDKKSTDKGRDNSSSKKGDSGKGKRN